MTSLIQPRRPYKGATVRYQAGATDQPGRSHPAIVVNVGYLDRDGASMVIDLVGGEVTCDFPGGPAMLDGAWLEVCTLAVFSETQVEYRGLISYSTRPALHHWNWPEVNPDHPCQSCQLMPGQLLDDDGVAWLPCPNCGAQI